MLFFLFAGALSLHAAAPIKKVILITPHVDAIRSEFGRGFAEWHLRKYGEKAEADFRQVGGTSDALRFVLSEFAEKPGGIGIDCFWGGGEEPFLVLGDKRLLMRYDPPAEILSGIPESINGVEVYDPNHTWYGAALSSFGILENLRVQRLAGLPFVRQWEELARPELFGWVGVGDPRNSGTMNVMFEAFLQFYGWERGWQMLTQIGGKGIFIKELEDALAAERLKVEAFRKLIEITEREEGISILKKDEAKQLKSLGRTTPEK